MKGRPVKRENVNGNNPGITLLGLGPGDPGMLTREALEWLDEIDTLYLRTNQHPTVGSLPEHLKIFSFDAIYEAHESFE